MHDDPIAPLRARFQDRCTEDAARLRAHLAGEDDADLEHRVHRIAGAAGMFGHADLGRSALAIDTLFAGGERPSREALAELADALERTSRAT